MKKKLGILVDILMYGTMLVQMLYVFTGNTVHEILGIVFFVSLICHIILKRHWFRGLLKFGEKPLLRKLFDINTLLLLLCMVLMMLSSLDVSRLLFPQIRLLGSSALHRYLATAVLTMSVVHGGLQGILRKKKKKLAAVLTVLGAGAALAIGLALVPYLNRHFKTVTVSHDAAVSGEAAAWSGSKPLVVYFTRVGNTDFAPDVDAVSGASLMLADGRLTGNTELLADMIADAVDCDVQAITLTGGKYPSRYNDTVSVAGKELRENARPAVQPIDISGYDSVILVYPLWWGTVPMPVASFLEQGTWDGKQLYLIATQGSSGYGSSITAIEEMAKGADVQALMSIYCDDIPTARAEIARCLSEIS